MDTVAATIDGMHDDFQFNSKYFIVQISNVHLNKGIGQKAVPIQILSHMIQYGLNIYNMHDSI